jgi:hypothetical protein
MELSFSLGSQPVAMKSAVTRPHAIKAPMFGMTIPLRNRPKDWIFCFMDEPPPGYSGILI